MSAKKAPPRGDERAAVAYLRVSTEDQHLGPEAQRSFIKAWAEREKITIVATFEDRSSGGAPLEKRPALVQALQAVKDLRAGWLVVAKRDRLARDIVFAGMIERAVERAGARVTSADGVSNQDTPEGMMMRGIMDLFAAYERLVIRSRTRAALQVKKLRGERVGTVPYGQQLVDGRLVPHDEEQRILSKIRSMRAGGAPIRVIAENLNAEGVPSRGRCWRASGVQKILANHPVTSE